ncbi:EamA family transporter RarD [Campylobacter concisus]|uniref:EamA family transporter RarD n=1 Tax=Campylobacter concisus TaxID=199 RepID=UPI0018AC1CAA|nr:EamA family transporter RarD [Campylobacter concisus]QPH99510.1 EamA family transporter RarD [Campylobacter concisus]QPI01306.1 EamA family transporter RarD [Campylobacter concisus]
MQKLNEAQKGVAFALSAFFMWGFLAVYFNLFSKDVDAYEILAHRVIWSFFLMAGVLYFSGKMGEIFTLLKDIRSLKILFLSGIFITTNWGVYVYAVSNGKILDTSLGYFINPLISMLLGVIIFKERLNKSGILAICIVVLAISVQIYAQGGLPLVSIILPLSFGFYAAVRKMAKISAFNGLFIETFFMFPFALAYVLYIAFLGKSHFGLNEDSLLMIASSIVTIVPLVAFNAAATRINLTTIGYLQYISPTIAILCAVFIYGENLDGYKVISFCMIWLALAIISIDKFRKRSKNE